MTAELGAFVLGDDVLDGSRHAQHPRGWSSSHLMHPDPLHPLQLSPSRTQRCSLPRCDAAVRGAGAGTPSAVACPLCNLTVCINPRALLQVLFGDSFTPCPVYSATQQGWSKTASKYGACWSLGTQQGPIGCRRAVRR